VKKNSLIDVPALIPKNKCISKNDFLNSQSTTNHASNTVTYISDQHTPENIASIVEFDAQFCSRIQASMLQKSQKDHIIQTKKEFSQLYGIIFNPVRKNFLQTYK